MHAEGYFTHAHTHTYIHTHIYTHTRAHTHMQKKYVFKSNMCFKHACTYSHTHTHMHKKKVLKSNMCFKHARMHTHSCMHAHMHVHTRSLVKSKPTWLCSEGLKFETPKVLLLHNEKNDQTKSAEENICMFSKFSGQLATFS